MKRALLTRMTDLIAGRYELRARISKGGMGAVWRAHDRRLRRDVAVKLLHAWIAEDLELRRRFAREARVLAPLEHEHIVRLYDYGEDGETPFLVMELVEGANLGDVARDRAFTWEQAAEIALPIASALAYAHARGIVHRDLTPGNVLIESATGTGRRLGLRPGAARPLLDERDDPGDAARDAGVLVARAGARARQRDARPTCTRSAACSSGCSPGGRRSRATTGWPSGCAVPTRRRRRSPRARPAPPARPTLLVDALLAPDPADRPTAVEVLERLGGCSAGDRGGGRTTQSRQRSGRRRSSPSRSRRPCSSPRRVTLPESGAAAVGWLLVAAGIAAAGALAFVGATIANADRIVEVPRVTGMTVPQARAALAEAAHVDAADAPLVVGSRAYSESVAAGHVIAQTPQPAARVERTALDLVVRVSRGTALAAVPDVEGASRKEAVAALRRAGFAAERSHRGVVGGARGAGRLERRRRR